MASEKLRPASRLSNPAATPSNRDPEHRQVKYYLYMAVSKRDREIMARQAAALKEIELPVEMEPTGEQRRQLFAEINKQRRAVGMPELKNDEDEIPEIGFHRIAVARGMVKSSRKASC